MTTEPNKILAKYEKREQLAEKLKPLRDTTDLRGHARGRFEKETRKYLLDRFFGMIGLYETEEDLDTLLAAKNKRKWVRFRTHGEDCPCCGEDVNLEFNGHALRAVKPCKYRNGVPPLDLELNVPTGKMVVANDLRNIFPVIGDANVNKVDGRYTASRRYAEAGMAHICVGNTCPGLYKVDGSKKIPPTKFELGSFRRKKNQVASICTDLWWVSIADLQAFLDCGGVLSDNYHDVVTCKPGVYRVRYLRDSYDGQENPLYAEIQWIRKPEPAVDFKARFLAQDYTLGQILHVFNESWGGYLDSFTKEDGAGEDSSTKRAQRMLDHLFFTLGNGADWHPNGWSYSGILPTGEIPEYPIPKLDRQFSWYPCSSYSLIGLIGGFAERGYGGGGHKEGSRNLNPSFWRGLVDCLKCIAQYGVKPRQHQGKAQPDHGTKNVAIATLVAMFNDRPERMTEEDTKFLKKFRLANALEAFKATQQIEAAISKHCPQPYKHNDATVMAQCANGPNKGGTQNRSINIAANLHLKRGSHTDFHWERYATWPLAVSKSKKTGRIEITLNRPKKRPLTMTLKQALVKLPKLCADEIARWAPVHEKLLPEILRKDQANYEASREKSRAMFAKLGIKI